MVPNRWPMAFGHHMGERCVLNRGGRIFWAILGNFGQLLVHFGQFGLLRAAVLPTFYCIDGLLSPKTCPKNDLENFRIS